jgi:hypothetical protein
VDLAWLQRLETQSPSGLPCSRSPLSNSIELGTWARAALIKLMVLAKPKSSLGLSW